MKGRQHGIAVDTRAPYKELPLGLLSPSRQTWKAPHPSDWALALGPFHPDPG